MKSISAPLPVKSSANGSMFPERAGLSVRGGAHRQGRRRTGGYVLFEVVLAVAVFSIVVAGLAKSLITAIEASNAVERDIAIRLGLDSVLREARIRPRKEMALTYNDEKLGIAYRTELAPLDLSNFDGEKVGGLYILRATAVYEEAGREETATAEIYVHRP